MNRDSLGDRMKEYENISRNYLTRRIPVIIRIDGKAFHTFTRGFEKPFDKVFMQAMQNTMKYLCENIQGCVLGYTQSDEITLVLTDYENRDTDAWFGYNIQKMASVAASMATFIFNREFDLAVQKFVGENGKSKLVNGKIWDLTCSYEAALQKGAMFDARCFSIPKEEVINCLIWRQQDAIRNSILSVGQYYLTRSQMHCLKCDKIQEVLKSDYKVNWDDDYSIPEKRGSCCVKKLVTLRRKNSEEIMERSKWIIDTEIPIFTQDRAYAEELL